MLGKAFLGLLLFPIALNFVGGAVSVWLAADA